MKVLKEAKYKYLSDKARRNKNYTLVASLPIFIFILFIIYAIFFDQEFFCIGFLVACGSVYFSPVTIAEKLFKL